jgi:hypothetical protein
MQKYKLFLKSKWAKTGHILANHQNQLVKIHHLKRSSFKQQLIFREKARRSFKESPGMFYLALIECFFNISSPLWTGGEGGATAHYISMAEVRPIMTMRVGSW